MNASRTFVRNVSTSNNQVDDVYTDRHESHVDITNYNLNDGENGTRKNIRKLGDVEIDGIETGRAMNTVWNDKLYKDRHKDQFKLII